LPDKFLTNLNPVTKRLVTLWKRKQRPSQLGFYFKHSAAFVLPSSIQIATKRLHLSLPDNGGTRTAFINVLLDDWYRLRDLRDDVQKVVDIGCHVGLFPLLLGDVGRGR
jgi:hypothetical protein